MVSLGAPLGNFASTSSDTFTLERPALVISPSAYNGRVGLALLCPITSQIKSFPFEVLLPAGLKVQGVVLSFCRSVVLSDQIKSLDWQIRRAELVDKVPAAVLEEAVAKDTRTSGTRGGRLT
ncbi:MAG: type II toxin-antitoxin system PemK/MazF family toxin [Vicinamibacteria bacterium]|nr:type II toxin-antitoxin system PemK/MazF family toxin [Vicinamibacteria bacterium]